MTEKMETLIEDLAAVESRPDLFNPYEVGSPANDVRWRNLRRYWREMAGRRPRVALIGEAIGYQGGRMTGIPFISERILRDPPEHCPFREDDFPLALEFARVWAEPTATMVWEALEAVPGLPLFWNGLPFHPHRPGDRLTNRAPRVSELALGRPFLRRVLDLFHIDLAVAVGNKAQRALSDLEMNHVKVRHPSHGGKKEFQQGIRALADQGWFTSGE